MAFSIREALTGYRRGRGFVEFIFQQPLLCQGMYTKPLWERACSRRSVRQHRCQLKNIVNDCLTTGNRLARCDGLAVRTVLANYSYANPGVPEINELLPLPSAELPPWDGKLQWLEERLANVLPQKPSEALIHQLAKVKSLDPATGRPLPDSPALIQAAYPWPTCNSGQACTQTGYWKAEPFYQICARIQGTPYPALQTGRDDAYPGGH